MTPAETVHAADRAYAHTKQLILSGALAGGAPVSEGTIAAELGISRTPVHEAFLRLDAERLLLLSSRRGAAVVPMAPDEARDVLEMREAIEASTARRALADGGPGEEVLAALRENLAQQRELFAAGDVEGFVEADGEFHTILVTAARNVTAVHFHALLQDRQHRLRFQLLRISTGNVEASLADHELMVAAATAGEAEEFCRLLHGHVRRHRGVL